MSILKALFKENVFIDFTADPVFGSDQMDVDYPCRFGTVLFQLHSTELLSQIADRIRVTDGYRPVHPIDDFTDETCDGNAWYDFYYGINSLGAGIGDSCIEFILCNSSSPDNEEVYTIDLTDAERDAMYERMDEQCRKYLGRGCVELLAEADRRMREECDAPDGR